MQLGFTKTGDAVEADDMVFRCDPNALYPIGHICNEYTKSLEDTQIRTWLLKPPDPASRPGGTTPVPTKIMPGAAGVCGTPWIDGMSNCYLILGAGAIALGLLMVSRR